jgi:hypothetical protein
MAKVKNHDKVFYKKFLKLKLKKGMTFLKSIFIQLSRIMKRNILYNSQH